MATEIKEGEGLEMTAQSPNRTQMVENLTGAQKMVHETSFFSENNRVSSEFSVNFGLRTSLSQELTPNIGRCGCCNSE